MRKALRRVLWMIPALVGISMFAFWLFTRLGVHSDASESLPLFVNRAPKDVRDRALDAAERIASGDSDRAGARELARLGGAALPHILPNLDTYPPGARARIALALAPIARRMQVGSEAELTDPARAVVFWSEFWQARSVDFRPAVVKRLVKRLGQRSSRLRREDILQLDTFALEELLAAMAPIGTEEDVQRVRRLARQASRLTGNNWTLDRQASIAEARAVASRWQRWWTANRASYVTFDGARRLVAMITETRYGHWATEVVRSRFGMSAQDQPVLDIMRERAPTTLWLVLAGLVPGAILAIALGTALACVRSAAAPLVLVVMTGALPLPVAALFWGASGNLVFGCALMTLGSGATLALYQRRLTLESLDRDFTRTLVSRGASGSRIAMRSLPNSISAVVSLLGAQVPMLVTSAFVVERVLALPGLGSVTFAAVRDRDQAWLMAIALCSVALAGLTQIASDVLLALLDRRAAGVLRVGARA